MDGLVSGTVESLHKLIDKMSCGCRCENKCCKHKCFCCQNYQRDSTENNNAELPAEPIEKQKKHKTSEPNTQTTESNTVAEPVMTPVPNPALETSQQSTTASTQQSESRCKHQNVTPSSLQSASTMSLAEFANQNKEPFPPAEFKQPHSITISNNNDEFSQSHNQLNVNQYSTPITPPSILTKQYDFSDPGEMPEHNINNIFNNTCYSRRNSKISKEFIDKARNNIAKLKQNQFTYSSLNNRYDQGPRDNRLKRYRRNDDLISEKYNEIYFASEQPRLDRYNNELRPRRPRRSREMDESTHVRSVDVIDQANLRSSNRDVNLSCSPSRNVNALRTAHSIRSDDIDKISRSSSREIRNRMRYESERYNRNNNSHGLDRRLSNRRHSYSSKSSDYDLPEEVYAKYAKRSSQYSDSYKRNTSRREDLNRHRRVINEGRFRRDKNSSSYKDNTSSKKDTSSRKCKYEYEQQSSSRRRNEDMCEHSSSYRRRNNDFRNISEEHMLSMHFKQVHDGYSYEYEYDDQLDHHARRHHMNRDSCCRRSNKNSNMVMLHENSDSASYPVSEYNSDF